MFEDHNIFNTVLYDWNSFTSRKLQTILTLKRRSSWLLQTIDQDREGTEMEKKEDDADTMAADCLSRTSVKWDIGKRDVVQISRQQM